VLDEPTIGLHPRDNDALLDTLEALKAKGNSLVIVEHDEDTMRRADTILDLGPGAASMADASSHRARSARFSATRTLRPAYPSANHSSIPLAAHAVRSTFVHGSKCAAPR
jgi:excinuclease UvrABC ATPase subunit